MSEMKLSGSVSQHAMEAAILEMEELVAGRIGDQDFERLFGLRWAKLKEMGIFDDALINAYGNKASMEEGHAVVDEKQQARLILARHDERRAVGRGKRRRKSEKPAADSGKAAADGTAGGEALQQRRDANGHGSMPSQGGLPPNRPAGNGWQT